MSDCPPQPAWDANAWLADLKQRLELAGSAYQDHVSAENQHQEHPRHKGVRGTRTSFALLSVGTVLAKIGELPGMRNHVGLAPLHDLVAALQDLGNGGKPSLLQPTPGVGKGSELTGQRFVRQYALLWVKLLEAAGMNGRAACRLVAQLLSEQGFVGRKQADGQHALSEGTVVDWRARSRRRDFATSDPRTSAFLERNYAAFRKAPDWPFSLARTVEVVREMASSPLIRSKSDNPSTQPDD